jgi:hypothetical protein
MSIKEFRVTATYETTVEVDQDYEWQVCDKHKPADDETPAQWDVRMVAIESCSDCDDKAYDVASEEAYGKFPNADDIDIS